VCEGLASRVHLCGCHGKHNKSMVPCVSQVMTKINKTFPLNQNLTCANCGSCVATCVIRNHAGKTVNNFFTGWASHPSDWNKPDVRDGSDQMVYRGTF